MGTEQVMPSSSRGGEERGFGGKFRKPPVRRPPPTPYDRPLANQSLGNGQRPDGGWLSKVVDPACRLIASGATRIFPSIFSKSPVTTASTTEDHDNGGTKVAEKFNGDIEGCTLNVGISEHTGVTVPREGEEKLNGSSDFEQLGQDKISNLPMGTEFSKIEQMVQARRFSRAEVNRLTEILSSRVANLSNVDSKEKEPNMTFKREGNGAVLALENPRTSTEENQEGFAGTRMGTSNRLSHFAVKEVVGASPVDIARAYMGSRKPEVSTDSKRIISKGETDLLQRDGFESPLVPARSPKSSVCWPGAMVHDQHDYSTPQSSRYGLHHFQRTPYSRSIYSKSKPELTRSQADRKRYQNILSTPRLQPQTPLFGQGYAHNDGNGSVGPIRRSRHKFLSEAPARGSDSSRFSQNGPSQPGNSNISEGFLPAIKKNLEVGSTSTNTEFQLVDKTPNSYKAGIPTLQTSNPAVRAILEHLDRNKPTPKEKSTELQLASAWKESSASKVTGAMPTEGPRLPHIERSDFHKNTIFIDKESSPRENDRENSYFEVIPEQRSTSIATDVDRDTVLSSTLNGNHGPQIKSTNETAFFGFTSSKEKNEHWPLNNQSKGHYFANKAHKSAGSELLKKPLFNPSGTRPVLASISVDKPHLRQTVFSDAGFSFPVTTSSGVLSEPPTPSLMPFSIPGGLPQPNDGSTIPSYRFGTKRSTAALVFSFPSTSTASMDNDTANIRFSFGSEKKSRISFRSVGKDAICY